MKSFLKVFLRYSAEMVLIVVGVVCVSVIVVAIERFFGTNKDFLAGMWCGMWTLYILRRRPFTSDNKLKGDMPSKFTFFTWASSMGVLPTTADKIYDWFAHRHVAR